MSYDGLLRAAAREGDEEALASLVRALAPDVYRFLCGMLGDSEEADDAMQETFVRVARSLGRLGEEGAEAWVFGTARKVAHDVRPTPSAAPAPGEADWALRALRSLDAAHRELVVARDLMGWEEPHIAEVFDIPPGEVAGRLADARSELVSRGVSDENYEHA